MRLLHLATRAEWDRARATGDYRGSTRDRTLAEEGFVHASTTSQLPVVADGPFYADAPLDDHVVLVVDAGACERAGSPLRWEVPKGGAQPFPHLYGPIPVEAVVVVLPAGRDDGGRFFLPGLDGLDVVDHPPDVGPEPPDSIDPGTPDGRHPR